MAFLIFMAIMVLMVVLMAAGLWAQAQSPKVWKDLEGSTTTEVFDLDAYEISVISQIRRENPEWTSRQVLARASQEM